MIFRDLPNYNCVLFMKMKRLMESKLIDTALTLTSGPMLKHWIEKLQVFPLFNAMDNCLLGGENGPNQNLNTVNYFLQKKITLLGIKALSQNLN